MDPNTANPNINNLNSNGPGPRQNYSAQPGGPSSSIPSISPIPPPHQPTHVSPTTSKKRRTASSSTSAPGGRGVANLTPDQLAKKRANDREAQRAIRERTKTQIETLERRIQELTTQQPYVELQNAVRQKELVEAENEEIRKRLNSVLGVLQPLVNGQSVLGGNALIDPSLTPRPEALRPAPLLTSGLNNGSQVPTYGDPRSATSATSAYTLPTQRQTPPSITPYTPQQNPFSPMNALERRPSNVSQLSRTSDEKLDLGYLLHSRQDSSNGREPCTTHNTPPSLPSCTVLPMHTLSPFQGDLFGSSIQAYMVPVRNIRPTCPLDGLLLDFLAERRQQAEKGMPNKELIGPAYPSVVSLLQPKRSQLSHPLSKVFTDMLGTFPDLSTLPEQVAVLYIMFLIMRWLIHPTPETYSRLPPWVTPRPSQLFTPHPAWIDYLPWPLMRERLIAPYTSPPNPNPNNQPHPHPQNQQQPPPVPFDEFFIPYTTTLSLNWPYEARDTLLSMPGTDELSINPVFERHLRELGNWSLGGAFRRAHPGLAETAKIKGDEGGGGGRRGGGV
ncbi:hypothetical protein ACLMJK_006428 [Lecanora helva]